MNKLIALQEIDNNNYFCSFNYGGKLCNCTLPTDIALSFDLESYYDYFNSLIIDDKNSKHLKYLEEIIDSDLFEFRDDCFYRNNLHISIPFLLVEKMYQSKDNPKELLKYDNFWYWVTYLNTDLRERIYRWLYQGDFEITQEGFLLTYRNVVLHTQDYKPFYDTVKKWKKSPKNFTVIDNKIVKCNTDSISLEKLHSDRLFTHHHNVKKRLFYKVGVEASIDRREANYDNEACSAGGLHVLSKENLEDAGNDYCGDGHSLACLVNPMNIVALPDDNRKIRVLAFYPFEEVFWENNKIIDAKTTEKASKVYAKMCNSEIKDYLENSDKYPKLMGYNFVDINKNFREIIYL